MGISADKHQAVIWSPHRYGTAVPAVMRHPQCRKKI